MRKLLLSLGLVSATAGSMFILLSLHFTGNFPWQTPHSDHVIQAELYSKMLKEKRDFFIHLPRDYDSSQKYPVMYVLDGSLDDESINRSIDVLSTAGYAPATIVVGIPNAGNESRQRDYTPPYLRVENDKKDSPLGKGNVFYRFWRQNLFLM